MNEKVEFFKSELREILIAESGDLKLSRRKDLTEKAKELGIEGKQLSSMLQEINASINWDFIEKQKEEAAKREEELYKALEKEAETIFIAFCENCGFKRKEEWRFCENCGFKF